MENPKIKDDITQMINEWNENEVITCPRCEHYNAILVTYKQNGTHEWSCRDCDYHVIQSISDYEERQTQPIK